jgi:hypothetical protein
MKPFNSESCQPAFAWGGKRRRTENRHSSSAGCAAKLPEQVMLEGVLPTSTVLSLGDGGVFV